MKLVVKQCVCLFIFSLLSEAVLAKEKVLVVGAGILGASIGYHLSLEEVEVTIIDMQSPASHASLATFAWINASWAKQPQAYHALNQKSVGYWHELSKQIGVPIKWGGSLEWFESSDRQKKLGLQIREQIGWGEAAEILPVASAKMLEPNVTFMGADNVAYSANDGAVDPSEATKKLLSAAQANGAKVIYPCKLNSIAKTLDGEFADTTCGSIPFDQIVLAVGAASKTIASIAKLNIPQRSTPGIIVVTEPTEPLLNRIVVAPGVHIHQRFDGRIVVGEQTGAPKTPAHNSRLKGRPNQYPNQVLAQDHAQRILDLAIKYVPRLTSVKADEILIGWRPLPLDGHPVLGYSSEEPSVYIAVSHSGITLAPIIGRLVAKELIEKRPLEVLNAYRPNRDFITVVRY